MIYVLYVQRQLNMCSVSSFLQPTRNREFNKFGIMLFPHSSSDSPSTIASSPSSFSMALSSSSSARPYWRRQGIRVWKRKHLLYFFCDLPYTLSTMQVCWKDETSLHEKTLPLRNFVASAASWIPFSLDQTFQKNAGSGEDKMWLQDSTRSSIL